MRKSSAVTATLSSSVHRNAGVINRLKRSIGGIDEGLWSRLPGLAPGQAIVSMTSMAWSLLVAINPALCKLRMADQGRHADVSRQTQVLWRR